MSTREGLAHEESAAQVRGIRSLGSIPLVVLTGAGSLPRVVPDHEDEHPLAVYMRNRVYGTQARLATLSTEGRQIVLEHVGHGIPDEAPGAVVDAIESVLAQIR
jgi:pimeloyl-ACP methyl ester carboxylesterase